MRQNIRIIACLLAASTAINAFAAESKGSLKVEMSTPKGSATGVPDPQKERELLATIQSPTTPPNEKAVACKLLTIQGSDKSVPVLAPLLADPHLASWARIALQAIPGKAADKALRDAVGTLQGNLRIGVINSIGERRDEKALKLLASVLRESNPEYVSAAAVALGKIGGSSAASTLLAALKNATTATAPSVAEGCIRCAEQFLAQNKAADARKLYDAVRQANVPHNKVLEATRGAILARGDDGLPMLLELLRSADKDARNAGLSTARELPGRKVTEAIAAELPRSNEAIQPALLLALADRQDPASLPTVMQAARTGSKPLRLVAVKVLERMGTAASVPVLWEVAASDDPTLSQAAAGALVRLTEESVDADVLKRLSKASGRELELLIRVAGQRQTPGALDLILKAATNPDDGVQKAALQAIGKLGGERQVPELLRLVQNPAGKNREEIETTIVSISSRNPGAVTALAPLAHNTDPAMRSLALRSLSASGGKEALDIVVKATQDTDPNLQDEAVRTLSTWPNTWPEDSGVAEPLLMTVRTSQKENHKVLAMRGYLQYIEGDTKLKPQEKVAKIQQALPLMDRPDEKRLAVATLGNLMTPASVDLLIGLAEDNALREDACGALLKVASKNVAGLPKADRVKALETVGAKSAKEATRKRAEERLKSLN